MMNLIRGLYKPALFGLALFVLSAATMHALGLRINTSPSLPYGLYIESADGIYVEFCPVEPYAHVAIQRQYRRAGNCPDKGTPLLKPIVARAGDIVDVSPIGISVGGRLLPNTEPQLRDHEGRPMLHWPYGRYIVPVGYVWVASTYEERSYDSRYFGPVPLSSIRARYRALITQ